MRIIVALVLVMLLPLVANAASEAVPTERDPIAAKRAVDLAADLRCLVCQNESIGESNADLAVDLRRLIREQIAAGKSDREIVAFMVERYGDFVLYRPPFKASTFLLWAGPVLLVSLGLVALYSSLHRRTAQTASEPLSPDERARAQRLLAGEDTQR